MLHVNFVFLELKNAVGEIKINEKGQVVVLEQNKLFIPPHYFLSWDYYDRSIRFGVVGGDKSICILETNNVYEVTCMDTSDGRTVFAGLTTGTVMVWTLTGINGISPKRARLLPKRVLDGHTDVVTALTVCSTHNFVVSASRDHTAIIWHLTKLTYIRQLKDHPSAVTAVAVNDTSGDIATSSASCIFLWTINGKLLSVVKTTGSGLFSNPSSMVLSLSFSTINEWDSRNVIMCGTSDGLVKMYSCEFKKITPNNEKDETNIQKSPIHMQDSKSLKEHLLKRQQRIQQHGSRKITLSQLSHDSSQASSPIHTPLMSSMQRNHKENKKEEEPEYKRQLILRRVLSDHTGYNQDNNSHPAPITSLSPSK